MRTFNLDKFPDLQIDDWIQENTAPGAEPELVWVDLETTGLDEYNDKVLEVGVMVTDMLGHIIPGGVFHSYVLNIMEDVDVNDFVVKMHHDSGLFDDLRKTRLSSQQPPKRVLDFKMENWLVDLLNDAGKDDNFKPELAGSSVHFDRAFMKVNFPHFHEQLHYRNVEVSGAGLMAKRLAGHVDVETGFKVHRAIPDLIDSIEYYKELAKKYFTPTDVEVAKGGFGK